MGYKREKIYKLIFEDEEFEGLEIRCKAVSVGTFIRVVGIDRVDITPADEEKLNELAGIVMDSVIDWNLEDDAQSPVPATMEGLLAQDRDFVVGVINSWTEAMAGVSRPLAQPSPNGSQSLEESIPMEPLSESQAS